MNMLPVMITGVGGGGVGEQILKCLHMSTHKYYLIGGDMNRNSKGFLMVDSPYILPPATDTTYVDTLLKICKKHDVKALFYGSEPELKVMSNNREIFEQNGIFIPLNPKHVIDICMDKNKTMAWLQENGFAFPLSRTVTSINDLINIDYLPVVLKPSVGGGGSVNTFIARDRDELEMFGRYLLKLYNEFIAQEYIGTPDNEYTVGIMCDMEGTYINSIAVKKNIMSGLSNKLKIKNTSGKKQYGDILAISSGISQGEIGRFPEVTKICREITERLGCTGPVNIQCRVQNDTVYVFEINPRISGTSSLRAMAGYNEPDTMIRKYIFNETITQGFDYKSGYIARGLEETFISNEFMESIPEAITCY